MSDPVRLGLSADAPPLAVEALERARGDAPDAARLGAIEAGVLAKLGLAPGGGDAGGGDSGGGGGPSAPPAGPAGASGSAGASALTKAGAATLAAGVAIVALVVITRTPDAPVTPAAIATYGAMDSSPAPAVPLAEPGPSPISVEDLPAASAAPSVAALPAPSARPAASEEDPGASEHAEVALLAQAQASLASRPSETLARCDEHVRRFASGTLVQEREVLAIDALLRLGRRPEAEARASRFRASFPRSGHLRRIEALLAP